MTSLFARLQEDDNPRLHRIPFLFIWIAGFGLAWLGAVIAGFLFTEFTNNVLDWNFAIWVYAAISGLAFGGMLALVNGWALRRRYGFIPRFWRTATIMGSTIATIIFFIYIEQAWNSWSSEFDISYLWQGGAIWLITIALFQSAVLFRVNRSASWLVPIAMLASVIGILCIELDPSNYNDYGIFWAFLFASAIQAFGTGFVTMRVMANPREGIVPKRESDVKAKVRTRSGLHPFTFIAFWLGAYGMGWVMLGILMMVWMLTFYNIPQVEDLVWWLERNAEWVFGVTMGGIIGLVTAIAQPWLIKQYSNIQVKHWVPLSILGWMIGGIGLWYYGDNAYYDSQPELSIALLVWFTAPAILQTIALWRTMRGGWMWFATGLVTGVLAIFIHQQVAAWSYNETAYVFIFSGVAQAIVSGAAFILLQAQQPRETPTELIAV